MEISEANTNNAEALTELTFRSKAYWNYTREQLAAWKDDLTITAEYINENQVFVLTNANQLYGYYSWINTNETEVELDNMFIDPTYIGKGFGKLLMQDFLTRMKLDGKKKITLYSEPKTEGFYQSTAGGQFKTIGQFQSTIKDRYLPIMELCLT
jgi:GNAT superfamily N-acetyltransferase